MPKNASEANSILQLKNVLHCDKIISFGDGLNDIPMFEISDECYAVENAVPELKKLQLPSLILTIIMELQIG